MQLGSALKSKIALSFFFLSLLSMCSCFSNASYEKYPQHWKPLQTVETDCIDISGSYSNVGEPYERRLSDFLLQRYSQWNIPDPKVEARATITHIEIIKLSEKKLKIVGWDGDMVIDERMIKRGPGLFGIVNFKCDEGEIRIFGGTRSSTGGGIFTVAKPNHYLSKSIDGALIVRDQYNLYSCCLYVPVIDQSSSWHRYEPVVKEQMKTTLLFPQNLVPEQIPEECELRDVIYSLVLLLRATWFALSLVV